jgi:hypothetical protein
MKQKILKNPLVRNILSALAVALFGFILLNLTFIFDFMFQSALRGFIRLLAPQDPMVDVIWFPPLMHGSFVLVIGLISWFVFKAKKKVLFKATFLTVPVAVVLVTVGIMLYRWPIVSFSGGGLLCAGSLYYFHRTKQPWLYSYAVILVGLTLGIFTLSGGEI